MRYTSQFKNNHFTEMCCVTSYLRLIDSCITQLKAQGPSRTCNESQEEEEEKTRRRRGAVAVCDPASCVARLAFLERLQSSRQGQIIRKEALLRNHLDKLRGLGDSGLASVPCPHYGARTQTCWC